MNNINSSVQINQANSSSSLIKSPSLQSILSTSKPVRRKKKFDSRVKFSKKNYVRFIPPRNAKVTYESEQPNPSNTSNVSSNNSSNAVATKPVKKNRTSRKNPNSSSSKKSRAKK